MAGAEATSPAPSRTAGHLVSAPGALSAAGAEAAEQAPTAYDLLERFKLPRGILPQGVTGLVLRQDSTFVVQLPSECSVQVGGFVIRYEPVISGSVTPGAIHGLRGVSVHILLDISVTDVVVTGDEVTFTAGIINKQGRSQRECGEGRL